MLGERRIRNLVEHILSVSRADQTEVVLVRETQQATRFANSYIHQNMSREDIKLRVRVVVGKKIGVSSTTDLTDGALQSVLDSAMTIAKIQPDDPDFISLPQPQPITRIDGFMEGTAGCGPERRARAARSICVLSQEQGLTASGAFTTNSYEYSVGNSLGVFAYYPTTLADLRTVVMSDTSSGYAAAVSLDVEDIDAESLGREAMDKAVRSRSPTDIPPGDYAVILEEYAVDWLTAYLASMAFSARAVQEGRSFMSGKFGQKVTSDDISIWDDGLDPRNLPKPFDFEGVPKQRVDFIKNGVVTAVVHNSYTASREAGKESTGHALPAPDRLGPFPQNVAMEPGDATKEEMLASTKRGLWVTRMWYVTPVDPLRTIITGMTRDGTFLIENGEFIRPVKDLRFTQSILGALCDVEMVGRDTKVGRGGFLESLLRGTRVPALKVSRFTFTSTTAFQS